MFQLWKNKEKSFAGSRYAVRNGAAQGNGTAGINEATQMVTSYWPATQLIYAIGAVSAIRGVKVQQIQFGLNRHIQNCGELVRCVYLLIVAATILRSFLHVKRNSYNINKGIGSNAGGILKRIESTISVHLRWRTSRYVILVMIPWRHMASKPYICLILGAGGQSCAFFTEQKVWRTRTDMKIRQ